MVDVHAPVSILAAPWLAAVKGPTRLSELYMKSTAPFFISSMLFFSSLEQAKSLLLMH
jgi:hypothetical protein